MAIFVPWTLQDALQPLGVKCEVRHPLDGKPETTMQEVLMERLIESRR